MLNCKIIDTFREKTSKKIRRENMAFLGAFPLKPLKNDRDLLNFLIGSHKLPRPKYIFYKSIIDKKSGLPCKIITKESFTEKIDLTSLIKLNEMFIKLQTTSEINIYLISARNIFRNSLYFTAVTSGKAEIVSGLKLKYSSITHRYTIEGLTANMHYTEIPWQKRDIGSILMTLIIAHAEREKVSLRVNSLRLPKWQEKLLTMGFKELNDIFTGPNYKDLIYKV